MTRAWHSEGLPTDAEAGERHWQEGQSMTCSLDASCLSCANLGRTTKNFSAWSALPWCSRVQIFKLEDPTMAESKSLCCLSPNHILSDFHKGKSFRSLSPITLRTERAPILAAYLSSNSVPRLSSLPFIADPDERPCPVIPRGKCHVVEPRISI